MKKIFSILAIVTLFVTFLNLNQGNAAVCDQVGLASDGFQTCKATWKYKSDYDIKNKANVNLFSSHNASSILNLLVADDMEGVDVETGNTTVKVVENDSFAMTDIILETPSMGSSAMGDQTNGEYADDTVQVIEVEAKVKEEIDAKNKLDLTEVNTTNADSGANIAIGGDLQGKYEGTSKISLGNSLTDWIKNRRGATTSVIRAGGVI